MFFWYHFHLVCFQKEIVIFVNVTETPHGCSRGGVPLLPLATSVCFSPPVLLCLLEQWSLDLWAAEWQLAPSTTTPRTTKEIQHLYFRNDKEQVILNNPMSGLCVVGVGRQILSISSLNLRGLTEYKKKSSEGHFEIRSHVVFSYSITANTYSGIRDKKEPLCYFWVGLSKVNSRWIKINKKPKSCLGIKGYLSDSWGCFED